MSGKDTKKPKKPAKNAYKMPEKFPAGEILQDKMKVNWILGNAIGTGGFGAIYSGAKAEAPSKYNYAVKIEPLENGPLFCERTVYLNIGKKEDVDQYTSARKLKHLGIPLFYGFGSHLFKKTDYRFIIIQKLGKDIWSYFQENKSIPYATSLKIAVQIMHVYEYMHGKGYVHCDVKGANLLLGNEAAGQHRIYVVDFGLACKFTTSSTPNPKKAHNGTIEYTSRDAHMGVMTRRGDMEILAYNLVHWTSSRLPWEKQTNPTQVQSMKNEMMEKPERLLLSSYKNSPATGAIKEFVTVVSKMTVLEEPPYDRLMGILTKELKSLKSDLNKLDFKTESKTKAAKSPAKPKTPVKTKTPVKRPTKKPAHDSSNESDDEEVKKTPVRSKKPVQKAESVSESEEISSDDEKLSVKAAKKTPVRSKTTSRQTRRSSESDENSCEEEKAVAKATKKTPVKSKTTSRQARKSSDSDEERKKKKTPVRTAKTSTEEEDSHDTSIDIFSDAVVAPSTVKRTVRKFVQAVVTSGSEEDLEEARVPAKRQRTLARAFSDTNLNKLKVSKPATTRGRPAKAKKAVNGLPKKSWKDCPTIVNGAKLHVED